MSYINYEILTSKNLSLNELPVLQLIKQNKTEDLSQEIKFQVEDTEIIEKWLNIGYIELIKGKKGQTEYQRLRTTKLGHKVLEDIEIPEVEEGDLKMAEYLFFMYLSHEDKERVLGNKKAITRYISILRNHLGFTLHEFFYFCEYFLAEYPFTKKLENIFIDKNKNRYGEFKNNIDDSVLFQFWEQKEQEIRQYWVYKKVDTL